jgi:hypothetical protein
MTLVNQPTLAPTRKMVAVGWTALLGPVVAAIVAPWLPGLSAACGGEIVASLSAAAVAAVQGVASFVSGYVVREREKSGNPLNRPST